jgi:hypothetical protein
VLCAEAAVLSGGMLLSDIWYVSTTSITVVLAQMFVFFMVTAALAAAVEMFYDETISHRFAQKR